MAVDMPGSTYSPAWFHIFMDSIPAAQSEAETAFAARCLPNPPCLNILDICCGSGRFANRLARLGYQVTGIDLDLPALEAARAAGTSALFHRHDMRRLADLPGRFDAAICMWQSFGHFDAPANREVLRQAAEILAPNGRLLLDIYHRGFHQRFPGTRRFERAGVDIRETKTMHGDRLQVHLDYPGGQSDDFEWQLFYPQDIQAECASVGLDCLLACSGFDERQPASPDYPRMQLLFAKGGA